ncbi:hypothetical protein FRC10_007917 [Ceratobasidium sp. 414]|nr:hypothetical protein FRC10_007917 [Ceratobasidium sp. 414]
MAKRECPCCGRWRSERTISRHLHDYENTFELPSDSDPSDNHDGPSDDNDANPELVDGGEVLGDVSMGTGFGQNEEPAYVPGDLNLDPPAEININPPADVGLNGVPLLDQLYRILRNPPVIINNWNDPTESDPSEVDNDPADGESVDNDQDPAYIERAVSPELDPDDEPRIDHDMLRAFLKEHLVDLDDDEWEELRKYP